MTHCSRRSILAVLTTGAASGCLGPSLTHDDEMPPTDDNTEDQTFDEATLERILEDIQATIDHIEAAAHTFATWREDPNNVDIAAFDELRSESTSRWSQYIDNVLPFEDDLRDDQVENGWAGDGEALADLLGTHESLLLSIEDGSIGVLDADGNPERVTSNRMASITFVIEESEDVITRTENAMASD